MLKINAKTAGILLCLSTLWGCVATSTIPASSDAGFVASGFSDGFQQYMCTAPKCGGDGVEVGHRTESGGVFAPIVDAALDNPDNRRQFADEFFDEFAMESDLELNRARAITIGGFEAYSASGSVSAAGFTFPVHVVLIVTDSKAELFLAVTDTASQARRGTVALARAWAQTQDQ